MKNVKQVVFIVIGVVMILLAVALIFTKKTVDNREENNSKSGTRVFNGPVHTLIFEAGACDVEIETGSADEYILSYDGLSYATISDHLEDGVLEFTYKQNRDWLTKLFFQPDRKDTHVTLTIPEDAVLERAEFEFGAAEIKMEQINAKDLSITVGAGELHARNITATEKASLQVGAGAFYADKVNLVNAELECGVGEMELSGVITGDSTVDCGVGEMQLDIDGDQDAYKGELNCGLGEIQFGDIRIEGSGKKSYGASSAESRMDIKCGIGEVDVRFR